MSQFTGFSLIPFTAVKRNLREFHDFMNSTQSMSFQVRNSFIPFFFLMMMCYFYNKFLLNFDKDCWLNKMKIVNIHIVKKELFNGNN